MRSRNSNIKKDKLSLKTTFRIIIFLLVIGLFSLQGFDSVVASVGKSTQKIYLYVKVNFVDIDFSSLEKIKDYNKNGISDTADIVIGAKKFISTNPVYKDGYYDGGYPPEGEGVCTDLVATAFLEAGYDLRELVDSDIRKNRDKYGVLVIDKNIDYRRVSILKTFFERNALVLSNDISNLNDFQAGDILIFPHHIGILSDKKNERGYPYIIHHGGQEVYEEDKLENSDIIGHYRWG